MRLLKRTRLFPASVAVFFLVALFFTDVGGANQVAGGVLTTTGSAVVSAVPDQATVVVGISVLQESALVAQQEVAYHMEKMRDSLRLMDIADKFIQTSDFRVGAEYEYRDGKQVLRGYRATHDLRITIEDLPTLGAALDVLVSSGATTVRDIQFVSSKAPALQQQALTAAVQEAQKKAEALAAGAGITTLRINRIQDQSGYAVAVQQENRAFAKAAMDLAGSTEIAPGEIAVRANVQVEYIFW